MIKDFCNYVINLTLVTFVSALVMLIGYVSSSSFLYNINV